uniref:Uncharacterized protein n=1 Tax=Arundo donax TaxID=35708 RepID=A0A0A8ZS41_ARUDO
MRPNRSTTITVRNPKSMPWLPSLCTRRRRRLAKSDAANEMALSQ